MTGSDILTGTKAKTATRTRTSLSTGLGAEPGTYEVWDQNQEQDMDQKKKNHIGLCGIFS